MDAGDFERSRLAVFQEADVGCQLLIDTVTEAKVVLAIDGQWDLV